MAKTNEFYTADMAPTKREKILLRAILEHSNIQTMLGSKLIKDVLKSYEKQVNTA